MKMFNTRGLARAAYRGEVGPVRVDGDLRIYNEESTCFSCTLDTSLEGGFIKALEDIWGKKAVMKYLSEHRSKGIIYWFMDDQANYIPLN